MPQGTVVPVGPIKMIDRDCLDALLEFIKENTKQDLKIGLIEICDKEGDEQLSAGELVLYIIPSANFPEVVMGRCNGEGLSENKPTKVKFTVVAKPFKYINAIEVKQE